MELLSNGDRPLRADGAQVNMTGRANSLRRSIGAWAVIAVLAFGLPACTGHATNGSHPSTGFSRSSGPVTVVNRSGSGYRVSVPTSWTPPTVLPKTVGLVLMYRGTTFTAGCNRPLLLLRQQRSAPRTYSLADSVRAYNQFQQQRYPSRHVLDQRPVALPNERRATLLVAEYRRGSRTVRTFDVLALTTSGLQQHLYASGCPGDLPSDFLAKIILSLHGA